MACATESQCIESPFQTHHVGSISLGSASQSAYREFSTQTSLTNEDSPTVSRFHQQDDAAIPAPESDTPQFITPAPYPSRINLSHRGCSLEEWMAQKKRETEAGLNTNPPPHVWALTRYICATRSALPSTQDPESSGSSQVALPHSESEVKAQSSPVHVGKRFGDFSTTDSASAGLQASQTPGPRRGTLKAGEVAGEVGRDREHSERYLPRGCFGPLEESNSGCLEDRRPHRRSSFTAFDAKEQQYQHDNLNTAERDPWSTSSGLDKFCSSKTRNASVFGGVSVTQEDGHSRGSDWQLTRQSLHEGTHSSTAASAQAQGASRRRSFAGRDSDSDVGDTPGWPLMGGARSFVLVQPEDTETCPDNPRVSFHEWIDSSTNRTSERMRPVRSHSVTSTTMGPDGGTIVQGWWDPPQAHRAVHLEEHADHSLRLFSAAHTTAAQQCRSLSPWARSGSATAISVADGNRGLFNYEKLEAVSAKPRRSSLDIPKARPQVIPEIQEIQVVGPDACVESRSSTFEIRSRGIKINTSDLDSGYSSSEQSSAGAASQKVSPAAVATSRSLQLSNDMRWSLPVERTHEEWNRVGRSNSEQAPSSTPITPSGGHTWGLFRKAPSVSQPLDQKHQRPQIVQSPSVSSHYERNTSPWSRSNSKQKLMKPKVLPLPKLTPGLMSAMLASPKTVSPGHTSSTLTSPSLSSPSPNVSPYSFPRKSSLKSPRVPEESPRPKHVQFQEIAVGKFF